MGRYYRGDIEGKFWFAVQSSDDASFFGGEEIEPNYLEYCFDETHLESIKDGLATCEKELGEFKGKLDSYFIGPDGWGGMGLSKYLGVPTDKAGRLVEWYARLELGEKILKCVQENGRCEFEAEL
jgi:hypothetical protein